MDKKVKDALLYFGLGENYTLLELRKKCYEKGEYIEDYYRVLMLNLEKKEFLTKIKNYYFSGLDLENGLIVEMKGINNYNDSIMEAYNVSERIASFSLFRELKVEYDILKDNFDKASTEEELFKSIERFLVKNGEYFARFTQGLLKKINVGFDTKLAEEKFEDDSPVISKLACIYFFCRNLFIDNKKSDEGEMKKEILEIYRDFISNNFIDGTEEYEKAMAQYYEISKLAETISFEKLSSICQSAINDLLIVIKGRARR